MKSGREDVVVRMSVDYHVYHLGNVSIRQDELGTHISFNDGSKSNYAKKVGAWADTGDVGAFGTIGIVEGESELSAGSFDHGRSYHHGRVVPADRSTIEVRLEREIKT